MEAGENDALETTKVEEEPERTQQAYSTGTFKLTNDSQISFSHESSVMQPVTLITSRYTHQRKDWDGKKPRANRKDENAKKVTVIMPGSVQLQV